MLNLMKVSLEDAAPITTQEMALDYIAKRGPTLGAAKDKRMQYAREILQKELLPHIVDMRHIGYQGETLPFSLPISVSPGIR